MRPIDADALIEFCAERWIPLNIDAVNMQPTIQPEKAQLSSEGTTSDLISRRAVLDALDFEIVHITAYRDGKNEGNPLAQYNKGLEDGKKAIEALPSAQPEPHEGHWINGKCDRCGEHAPFWCMASTYHESKYCPNCGAKMKGERQNEYRKSKSFIRTGRKWRISRKYSW